MENAQYLRISKSEWQTMIGLCALSFPQEEALWPQNFTGRISRYPSAIELQPRCADHRQSQVASSWRPRCESSRFDGFRWRLHGEIVPVGVPVPRWFEVAHCQDRAEGVSSRSVAQSANCTLGLLSDSRFIELAVPKAVRAGLGCNRDVRRQHGSKGAKEGYSRQQNGRPCPERRHLGVGHV